MKKIISFGFIETNSLFSIYSSWPNNKLFGFEKSVHWQGHIGWFHFKKFIFFGRWVIRNNKFILGI